jgi:hypothetical protein
MAENRVMKLWTAIVSAFLALFTALGFVAATATAATAQTGPTHTGSENAGGESADSASARTARITAWPAATPRDWPHARSLPPTMKQRIRAEAHGKSPSCRHRALSDSEATEQTSSCDPATTTAERAEPLIPLQR